MNTLLQLLIPAVWLQPVVKPIARSIVAIVAIPIFRTFLKRVIRKRDLGAELEQDLEKWFRGGLMLLVATANMESIFFGWAKIELHNNNGWWVFATRLMLAVGVIEAMPDQALFAIIHRGPPRMKWIPGSMITSIVQYLPSLTRGMANQYLNRTSPVLAIMTVVFDGPLGWWCFGIGLLQYLVIGLVSSRDRALDVLSQFDAAVGEQRKELEKELAERRTAFDEQDFSGGTG